MQAIIPLLSTAVTLVFAAFVFAQFASRRKPYQLAWAVALIMFAGGTGSELISEATGGWNEGAYRVWYLCGAVLVVAYLALGTIYLITPRKVAHTIMALLVVASIYSAYAVFSATVDMQSAMSYGHISGTGFPQGVRLLTPFFNGLGTVVLVGGALYSAWIFWSKKILLYRVKANVLIAAGALVVAAAGSAARFGSPQYLYVGELIGICVIFSGFLASRGERKVAPAAERVPQV